MAVTLLEYSSIMYGVSGEVGEERGLGEDPSGWEALRWFKGLQGS